MSDLIIRIGGEGGEGIISAGDMIAQTAARSGLKVLTFKTFPAEIRGGYAMYQIRFSNEKIKSEGSGFDVCCTFNQEALDQNRSSLKPGTVLVYDYPGGDIKEEVNIEGVTCYPIPMSQIAKKELEMYRAKNMVALGALSELFDIDTDSLRGTIHSKFDKKGEKVVGINMNAIDAGIKFVKENHKKTDPYTMGKSDTIDDDVIIISGNYAAGMGALFGGCNFLSCYPITPATEVAIFMSQHLPKTGGRLVQAEDEMASLANVLGASFAGAKAMTSTSGPGLSLMQELLGYASIAELPCVVIDVQRGGPSTGLPTKHEQSDLFMAAHGGHGDAPRIVLSPENVEDIISVMAEAFNLAEEYQSPVIVLSDGSLGFRTESIKRPDPASFKRVDRKKMTAGDADYKRYALTESGISPMSIPGEEGGAYIATGLEHKETSAPSFAPDLHVAMSDKRFKKLDNLEERIGEPESQGDDTADLGVMSWGSTMGTVREAVDMAIAEGLKVRAIHSRLVWPVPVKAIEAFAKSCGGKVLIPEINFQGQLAELIKSKTSVDPIKYTLYGGEPLTPVDLLAKIKEVI